MFPEVYVLLLQDIMVTTATQKVHITYSPHTGLNIIDISSNSNTYSCPKHREHLPSLQRRLWRLWILFYILEQYLELNLFRSK